MGNLTALAVEKAKPAERRREIADGGGLYLIVQPSGAKSWAYRYRNADGVARKLTLGSFPVVTLEKARLRARKAATEVDEQKDPAAEKLAIRAAKKPTDANRVESIVTNFIERHAKEKTREATWRESERILQREIVSRWRGKSLSSIRQADIHTIIDAIMDRGKPAAALRSLQAIRPFFKWAVRRGVIAVDPTAGIDAPSMPRERERALTDTELEVIWRAAEAIGYPFGPVVQLLVLLGQRRNEVAGIAWSELDLAAGIWTLPATRVKNGRAHMVPLPSAALGLINALPRTEANARFLFSTTGITPVSGFAKAKRKLDRAIEAAGGSLASWTFHDLRRTMATGCASLATPPHVIEAILNHHGGVIRGVARIYNRYDHAAEKRAALDAWSRHIEALVQGTAGVGSRFRA